MNVDVKNVPVVALDLLDKAIKAQGIISPKFPEGFEFYRSSERTYRHGGTVPQGGWLRVKLTSETPRGLATYRLWFDDLQQRWHWTGLRRAQ